jgi:hypothetical protein
MSCDILPDGGVCGSVYADRMKQRVTPAIACVAASAVLAVVAGAGFVAIQPRYGEGAYAILRQGPEDTADDAQKTFTYPLRHWQDAHVAEGTLLMRLGRLHPTIFRVYPDDCLEAFSVNGGSSTDGPQYCDYNFGHDLDWTPYVVPGDNTVYFKIRNFSGAGGFRLGVSPWDPVAFPLVACALASLALLCAASFLRWGRDRHHRVMLGIFWAGAFLRLVYVIRTPFGVRAYDFDGHVDYLMHVLNDFTVPHAQAGWQFYQPPLYYFLNAPFLFPLKALGASEDSIVRAGQFVSLGISCVALGLGAWIALLLFRGAAQRFRAYLFFSAVAVFPGIVYMASRISNDALIVPLSFAFLGFTLRWWKAGETRDALLAALMLALGVLTKSNFFAFLPVFAFALLLRRGTPAKRKVRLGAAGLGILVLLTGWYFFLRVGMEHERNVVGNIGSNAPGLRVEIKPENFFIFRPQEVVRVPYAHAWSDFAGRNRFWEHLFKTAHTGEWDFGFRVHAVMRPMLILSMLLLLVAIGRGLYLLWFDAESTLVLWTTTAFLVFSMMALLILENVGGFQDFRYVPGLVVPVTWYMLDGIRVLPRPLRVLWTAFFCSFLVLAVPFYYVLLFP